MELNEITKWRALCLNSNIEIDALFHDRGAGVVSQAHLAFSHSKKRYLEEFIEGVSDGVYILKTPIKGLPCFHHTGAVVIYTERKKRYFYSTELFGKNDTSFHYGLALFTRMRPEFYEIDECGGLFSVEGKDVNNDGIREYTVWDRKRSKMFLGNVRHLHRRIRKGNAMLYRLEAEPSRAVAEAFHSATEQWNYYRPLYTTLFTNCNTFTHFAIYFAFGKGVWKTIPGAVGQYHTRLDTRWSRNIEQNYALATEWFSEYFGLDEAPFPVPESEQARMSD